MTTWCLQALLFQVYQEVRVGFRVILVTGQEAGTALGFFFEVMGEFDN